MALWYVTLLLLFALLFFLLYLLCRLKPSINRPFVAELALVHETASLRSRKKEHVVDMRHYDFISCKAVPFVAYLNK